MVTIQSTPSAWPSVRLGWLLGPPQASVLRGGAIGPITDTIPWKDLELAHLRSVDSLEPSQPWTVGRPGIL